MQNGSRLNGRLAFVGGRHKALQARNAVLQLVLGVMMTAALATCLFCGRAFADPVFPPLTGQIVDEAGLLSAQDRTEILAELKSLEGKSSDQVVVYTSKSLQGYPIEEFGYRLGRAWKIGQEGVNNGVILIVAPAERKVRIEVGRGLEPQLTDLLSSLILRNTILPAFRRGDYPAGIKAGVRDIRDTLLGDAEAVKERAKALRPATRKAEPGETAVAFLFVIGIILLVLYLQSRQTRQLSAGGYRRNGDNFPIIIPGGWGGSGGWSGGRGGGGDGGSWSGGGGDFGGGGASGDY